MNMKERIYGKLLHCVRENIALKFEILRLKQQLRKIKTSVDSFYSGKITYTIGTGDFDVFNHKYDISTLIRIIREYTYAGLDIPLPHDDG